MLNLCFEAKRWCARGVGAFLLFALFATSGPAQAQAQSDWVTLSLSSALINAQSSGLTITASGLASLQTQNGLVTAISLPAGLSFDGSAPINNLTGITSVPLDQASVTFSLGGYSLDVGNLNVFFDTPGGGPVRVFLSAFGSPIATQNGSVELVSSSSQTVTPFVVINQGLPPQGLWTTGDVYFDPSTPQGLVAAFIASTGSSLDQQAATAMLQGLDLGVLSVGVPVPEDSIVAFEVVGLGLLVLARVGRRRWLVGTKGGNTIPTNR